MSTRQLLQAADEVKRFFETATVRDLGIFLANLDSMEIPVGLKSTFLRLEEERLQVIRWGLR